MRLPFLHAPSLQIGQLVSFTLSSAGEALGAGVQQPGADDDDDDESVLLQKPVQRKAVRKQT